MVDLQVRGARFHVQYLGEGPRTVVFLHGLVMDNLSSWFFTVANPVATSNEVLLYDLRGHGRSERTPDGYTVGDMVLDLLGVLDAAGITRPVHLVGNSFGGLLALAFAIAHPSRVAGICLVDAHLLDEAWGQEMRGTLGLQGEERDLMIASQFKDWSGRHSERKRNRLAKNAAELVYGTSLVEDLASSPPVAEEELSGIRCPVLALYGEQSDIRQRGERIHAALPNCTLEIIPGCTHSILWEETSAMRDRILAWLQQQAPPVRTTSLDEDAGGEG